MIWPCKRNGLKQGYCDMTPERRNNGARETATARQRPCKQATIPEPSLGNESASNNGRTVGGGVLYTVRAEESTFESPESALCSESIKLAWDGHQPARHEPESRGMSAVGRKVTEDTGLYVIVICEVQSWVLYAPNKSNHQSKTRLKSL
jgi:hypothetical protein